MSEREPEVDRCLDCGCLYEAGTHCKCIDEPDVSKRPCGEICHNCPHPAHPDGPCGGDVVEGFPTCDCDNFTRPDEPSPAMTTYESESYKRIKSLQRQLQAERTRREDDQRKGAELCNVLGNLMHQHHRLTRVTERLVGAMEGGMNPDLRADAKEVLRDTKLTDEAVQRWKAKYSAQDSSSTQISGADLSADHPES